MQIYAFQGNQRAGKGIGATSYALFLALQAYRLRGVFPRIFSNYHFNLYPYFRYFTDWKELENVRNAIVVYDEIGGSQDARLYNSKSQILFTNVFNQMGKMGNVFIYTCQREFQVEKRVREQTDYVIECTKDHLTGVLTQDWLDVQRGRETPKAIGRYVLPFPKRVYAHYNTFEVVTSQAKFDNVHAKG